MKKPDWQREALTAIKNQISCFRNKKRSRSERMGEIMQIKSTVNPNNGHAVAASSATANS